MPFSLHGFPAPSRRRFPALPYGIMVGHPMQTVMRFSRCGAGFDNKKSPHNDLNLTIPSWMALVRVCYVAIRKSKTCSGSFGSRVGTLTKYVILNCWDRLPQKSSHVNVNLSGRGPSILLRKRALLKTRHFQQHARKNNENFGKKREPGGIVLVICFLPAVPDRDSAPHPPTRPTCHRRSYTCRPERPDLPLPGTR